MSADDLTYDFGLPITLHFGAQNVAANADTHLIMPNGGAGLKVPSGYNFHPMLLHGEANANPGAGNATFKVTANAVAVTVGPTVAIAAGTQVGSTTQRPNVGSIAAGKIVGVDIVADANFAANTIDMDVILVGILLPA